MKFKTLTTIFAWILITFSLELTAGNVTILTHGFKDGAGNTNSWIWNMAYRIGDYERRTTEYGSNLSRTFYKMYFENGVVKSTLMFGPDPKQNPSGDIIIVLDWTPQNGGVLTYEAVSTIEVSASIARFLVTDLAFKGINGPITQFPIHLIGHSRGGSLVCEIGKRLGEYGIFVHHITTLDPHPLNNDGFGGFWENLLAGTVIDGSARFGISYNVIFSDNYYQQNNDLYPNGTYVEGAANRNLNKELKLLLNNGDDEHYEVHLWYHCTLTESFPATSDGNKSVLQYERNNWFTTNENRGRSSGYYSSNRAGQKFDYFTISGYHSDFLNCLQFGIGNQFKNYRAKAPSRIYGNKSKNILGLESMNTHLGNTKNFDFGGPIEFIQTTKNGTNILDFVLIYQADYPNSIPYEELPLYLFADSDESLLNDITEVEKVSIPSTGEWSINRLIVNYSNIVSRLKPGAYRLGAIIGDGLDARQYYAKERVIVEPDVKIAWSLNNTDGSFVFWLYGTKGRQYLLHKSFDLKNWEQIYSGTFQEREKGVLEGLDVVTFVKIDNNPKTFYKLSYK